MHIHSYPRPITSQPALYIIYPPDPRHCHCLFSTSLHIHCNRDTKAFPLPHQSLSCVFFLSVYINALFRNKTLTTQYSATTTTTSIPSLPALS